MNSILQTFNSLKEGENVYQEVVALNRQIKGDKNYKTIVLKILLSDISAIYTILKRCRDLDSQQEFVLFLYKVLPVSVVKKHRIFGKLQDEFLKISAESFDWSCKNFLVLFNADQGQLVCARVYKLWFQEKEVPVEERGFIFLNTSDLKVNAGKQVFKIKYESVEFFSLGGGTLSLRIKNNNNLRVLVDGSREASIRERLVQEGIDTDSAERGAETDSCLRSEAAETERECTETRAEPEEAPLQSSKADLSEKEAPSAPAPAFEAGVHGERDGGGAKQDQLKPAWELPEISDESGDTTKWSDENKGPACSIDQMIVSLNKEAEESALRTPKTLRKKRAKHTVSTPFRDLCLSFEAPAESVMRTAEVSKNITVSVESVPANLSRSRGGSTRHASVCAEAEEPPFAVSSEESAAESSAFSETATTASTCRSTASQKSRKKRKKITFTPRRKGRRGGAKQERPTLSSVCSADTSCFEVDDPFMSKPIVSSADTGTQRSSQRPAEPGCRRDALLSESLLGSTSLCSEALSAETSSVRKYAEEIVRCKAELLERIKERLVERERKRIFGIVKKLERFGRYKIRQR